MNFLVSGAAKLNGGHNAAVDYDVSTTLGGVEIWYQSHDCETVKRAFYRACRRTFLRTYPCNQDIAFPHCDSSDWWRPVLQNQFNVAL